MRVSQADKAKQFRALHEAPDAFVVANVWDGGSARMMAAIGFKALAKVTNALEAVVRMSMNARPNRPSSHLSSCVDQRVLPRSWVRTARMPFVRYYAALF